LDKKAFVELLRLTAPAKIIQSCLEVVYMFLEVFPQFNSEFANDGLLPRANWSELKKMLSDDDFRTRCMAITPLVVNIYACIYMYRIESLSLSRPI
jgi:hypothetical protein